MNRRAEPPAPRDDEEDDMSRNEPHSKPLDGGPRRVRAADVLDARGMLQIEHEGEVYTLRLTRNNRLILTK